MGPAARPGKLGVACVLAAFAGCALLAPALWAGEARLVEGGPDRVVIDTSGASVDEVLAVLAAHFEFAVERSAPSGQSVRFSGRLQGSLDQVLERLLRHQGHMIVRSADAQAGISRILLIEAARGVPATELAGPIAAIKAKLRGSEEAEK
jgi:hypothetical protein